MPCEAKSSCPNCIGFTHSSLTLADCCDMLEQREIYIYRQKRLEFEDLMDDIGNEGRTKAIPAIDHVAIAVPDIEKAASLYRNRFKALVDEPVIVPEQAIRIAYVHFANATIELMQPLSENSPVGKFLARNPDGGLHHICLTTKDAAAAHADAAAHGLRPLQPPAAGHHGSPLFFLHPKATFGTLIEIEEAATVRKPINVRNGGKHESEP